MPANHRFYLNALKIADRQLPEPTSGKWKDDGQGKDFLEKFPQDILVDGVISDAHSVHSVPSAYARPILFYEALSDPNHPLHLAVRNEWRGLLAVFALKEWSKLNLTASEFRVPQFTAGAISSPGVRGTDSLHLDTVLRQQLPQPTDAWELFWLIRCDGQLIGATSPWSLVYTPAQYQVSQNIGWKDQRGLFVDPIKCFDRDKKGTSVELGVLSRWVTSVLTEAPWGMDQARFASQFATLKREFGAWAEDLKAYAPGAPAVSKLAVVANVFAGAPYSRVLVPLDGVTAPESGDLIVNHKVNGPTILLSRKLQGGERISGSVFARDVDLLSLPSPEGRKGWKIKKDSEKKIDLPYVIAEELFFPPRLAALEQSENALTFGSKSFAVPLTPEFFEYFNWEDFKQDQERLRVYESSAGLRAVLNLPLENGSRLTIEKTYKPDEQVHVQGLSPALAIWPNFIAGDWTQNRAAFAGPTQAIGKDDAILVCPVDTDGGREPYSRLDPNEANVRIWELVKSPIGFSVKSKKDGDMEGGDVGLVLRATSTKVFEQVRGASQAEEASIERPSTGEDTSVDEPATVKGRKIEGTWRADGEWIIAVDFGTSNSHVMFRQIGGAAGAAPLPIRPRTTFLTVADPNNQNYRLINNNLYPAREMMQTTQIGEQLIPPLTTLVYSRLATTVNTGSSDYTIRFFYDATAVEQPVNEVKWGGSGQLGETAAASEALKDFLRGLVRAVLAEARAKSVAKVTMRWSSPLSLPITPFTAMDGFWRGLAADYNQVRRWVSVDEDSVSESDAACRCLNAHYSSLNILGDGLAIVVDIGGGSTDFAIWGGGNLLDQFSFKLASSDVLARGLERLPDYLPSVFRVCRRDLEPSTEQLSGAEGRPELFINNLLMTALTRTGQRFAGTDPSQHPAALAITGNLGAEPWSSVRSMAYLFFTGITFYTGLHARKWITNRKKVKIYVGGRGSSTLSWLAADDKTRSRILEGAFRQGLERQHEENKGVVVEFLGPAIRFSDSFPDLKTEVALGLFEHPLGNVTRKEKTIVGETGYVDDLDKEVAWDTELSLAEIEKLKAPASLDDSYAAFFAAYVVSAHLKGLGLNEDVLSSLKIREDDILQIMRSSVRKSEILQPVFSSELRALMQQCRESILRSV